jgi:O-acetyl-ADP-ribose deacetylase (regulator of RNase III)
MITEITGNIIDLAFAGEIQVLVHGCNCKGYMGKGLALEIKERCPEAYVANKNSPRMLGTYSSAIINNSFFVVNAYTQDRIRNYVGERVVNYEAVYRSLEHIKIAFTGTIFGMPRIGCSLAGGNWRIIEPMIEEIFEEDNVFIVNPY